MILMIGKGASEIRPATLSEVAKILEKRQGTAGEFGFEQQTSLDYAKKFGRLKVSDAQEMQSELEKLELKNETAVKITDILPSTKAQLLLILSKDKVDAPEKKLGQIEEIVAKFSKKAKKIESKPADEAAAEGKAAKKGNEEAGKKNEEAGAEEKAGKKDIEAASGEKKEEKAAPGEKKESPAKEKESEDEGKKKTKKEKE
jgi:DNA-directed RNA polymerase subunit F